MNRWLTGFAISAALIFTSILPGGAGAVSADNGKTIRVLIDANQLSVLKKTYGVRHDLGKSGFTTEVSTAQYQTLKALDGVNVTPVGKVRLPDDLLEADRTATPSDQTPWGIEAIYNNPSISSTSGGDGVRVAVLDTGVKIDHPDLTGQAEQCKDFTGLLGRVDGRCTDLNGHGTHVSGTILANSGSDGQGIWGVSPGAKLWAYKVLGDAGIGFSDDIAAAIRHAADESSRLGVKTVISMSLGSSGKDDLIAEAVTYAVNKGVLVVAAAGNDGPDEDTIGYPGGLSNAVAVAALENVQENGTYRIADFSSRGNPATDGDYVITERDVEVSAPGRSIESTWNDGTYHTISGTSMATPHISGLAAKLWADNPSWSNQQLRSELQNRAQSNDILGGIHAATGDDIASGFGFPRVK
ncbi:subtilisin [Melghirimyces profundicolus]|uniref:Subtilisin n=1 Tax=Melghirimyces profundicolus TaxID=1242148 RepID=A0A2T6B0L0_9BACL|nr:S8 family serine peptidase [Melghirimyces profundicolus]PTX49608.1 subtilisin [Melghirimyces profundicolus]